MTEALTVELGLGQEETQRDKYLTFLVEKEYYGIEIKYVTEIIGIQSVTEVPDLPEYIRGIINLRGKIIPVMDVRLRFGKEFREYDDRTCIIVIDAENILIGLIVDSVCEVMSIPNEEIVAPPDFNQSENKFIKGIGKTGSEVKLILDCERLLMD
ncbi:chemotaxis protein CheW [Acetivibrio straminisolvens]|uniref:Positive regulator of CheA protein activity n=1 Tax=Acetivibrio straminisolvens JCM 21531 TaxID=1294263 RepID=W4VBW1_9FIRM|nr:chemotaxis protein CheW [Acetivibrio straminisolvens]GAE90681.1 positive regulator of CheA protein activity [Acetivibrio straminisolvens JCM 21531]